MSDEKTRKAAYAYVAQLIENDLYYSHELGVNDPELQQEVFRIRDVLKTTAALPPIEEVPF